MNEPMLRMMMDAIDDDLLEEAQRPLPARRPALRWGMLAACLCIAAALLLLAQPWRAGQADSAMDGAAAPAPSAAPAAGTDLLSATLALPADAVRVSDYDLRTDEGGGVTAVSCTVAVDGWDYAYGAVYTAEPLPAPDGATPSVSWEVSGLTLLLYDDGAVGWYDAGAGIQWYCVPWDGGEPLVTAFSLMDAQAYTVPSPPEGAEVLGYDLFELDGMTVTEVSFRSDGLTWHYRMAPTADVTEEIPDISQFTGGSETAEAAVRWCSARLYWTEGGASAAGLTDMARRVFVPAQEES